MKTRFMLIGVAMAAALNCAAVNAQVLGGGLGGTLSGGLRDMNMATQGTLNGSLGADLDTSTLRRTTRDTAERATNRARRTTSAVRDRATEKVDLTREKAGEARQVAAATAVGVVDDVQIEGAADMAGSATSSLSREGINLAGDAQGTGNGVVSGGALPQPELTSVAPGKLASGDTANVSNVTQRVAEPAKDAAPTESAELSRSLGVEGDSNGSASASRSGVSAEGNGAVSASQK